MTHIDDQAAAYSLGALEPRERLSVQEHLRDCARCRGLVDEMSTLTAGLADIVTPVDPPAGLRDRIVSSAPSQLTVQPAPIAIESLVRAREARRPNMLRIGTAATLVAAAAVVIIALWRLNTPPSPSALARWTTSLQQARSAGDKVSVLGAHGVKMAVVQPPSGVAQLILGPSREPPPGGVYELWFIKSGKAPLPMGTYHPGMQTGERISLSRSDSSFTLAALTVEPGPKGTVKPTQAPFVAAKL